VRWYPKTWQARYGEEFTQLLVDDIRERPRSWQRTLDVARSGLAAQFAQRPLLRPRLLAAGLTLGLALAGAAVLHATVDPNQQIDCPHGRNPQAACTIVPGHGWVNPAAVGIALLGLGAATALVLTALLGSSRLRRVAAAVILGAGAAEVAWVATYRQPLGNDGYRSRVVLPVSRPLAWTSLESALIAFAAMAIAVVFLRRSWRVTRLTLAVAVLVLATAVAGASVHVLGHRGAYCNVSDPRVPYGGITGGCLHYPEPRWVDPTALALCTLAAAGAAVLLVTARTRRTLSACETAPRGTTTRSQSRGGS